MRRAWLAVALPALAACSHGWEGRLAPAAAAPWSERLAVVRVDGVRNEPERRHDRSVLVGSSSYYPSDARMDPAGTKLVAGGRTVMYLAPSDRLVVRGAFRVGERTPEGVVVREPPRGGFVGLAIAGIVVGGALLATAIWGTGSYCGSHRCTDPFDANAALLSLGIGASGGVVLVASSLLLEELFGRFALVP